MVEPNTTALLLLVIGVLLAASVLFSRASGRIGVPVVLIFLIIGWGAGGIAGPGGTPTPSPSPVVTPSPAPTSLPVPRFEGMLIDDARRENVFGLLMSLNMLIEFGDAFDYSGADFRGWCSQVGFRRFDVIPLAGPSSAAVAYK